MFFRKPPKMQLTNHSLSALMKSYGRIRRRSMGPAKAQESLPRGKYV